MKLRTSLLPHQVDAVEKLMRPRVGALFADMGTGKSRIVMEIAARREERISRVLWFCPVSLKAAIAAELEKHVESPSLYLFDDRTTAKSVPRDRFWYIVGIESLSSSLRVLSAANSLIDARAMMVLDESTYIKGPWAGRTKWATRLGQRCRYRMVLSGTPITQGVEDLFAQMRFLSPEILGYASWYSFAANHLEYSEKFRGKIVRAHNVPLIAAKIAPYTFQVRKEECLTLPPKRGTSRWCSMTVLQRQAYEQAKNEILDDLDAYPDDWWQSAMIYRLFTALQTIGSGFWHRRVWQRRKVMTDEVLTFPHGRLDMLVDFLHEIPDGERVIVWTRFLHCVEEIRERLGREFVGRDVRTFCGRQTPRDREAALAAWRSSQDGFLIATPSCGGHGLTLNEAAYVAFYDNGFKFSERIQAEDRCYRIGQERSVLYADIACYNSLDDRIQAALARKSNLLDTFRDKVDQVRGARTFKQALREVIAEL